MTTEGKCVSDCPYYSVNATNNERMCLQSNNSCHVESGETREDSAVSGLRCESECEKMSTKRVQLQDGKCSDACPTGQFNQEGVCVKTCDEDYFISYDKKNCVKYCSSYSEAGDGQRQCNENCSESQFVKISGNSFTCVETCDEEGYVSAGLLCVQATCQIISDGSTYKGYEKYVFADGNKCLTKCPSERKYFSENKTC